MALNYVKDTHINQNDYGREELERGDGPDDLDDLDDDLDANASPRIFVVFYGWFVVTAITGLALHWRLWRRGEAEHEIKAEGLATTMGTSREPPVNEATRLIAWVEVCSAAVL